ncbi:cytochrome P450 [Aspergillus homomorphus CBS 101889]|uniref:Cytochrome P450 n=1 Tax=Aspergillus homomorphus (strain CBS 101889) TaxID=1450537 RepID=A0A395I2G9_ASPHC|nr:cytochrome P450 [Aspergillus homomorphus CBS 101889]RAL13906.1 cytochrome P450 [Aspergillus homomorphus CBS 101889]
MADDVTHARLRRAMNPAFAPCALAAQESILQSNIDTFIRQLRGFAERNEKVNLRLWYNYLTFDLIGDLAFGEGFGRLRTSTCHGWVHFVLDNFYISALLHVVHRSERPASSYGFGLKIRRRIQQVGTERADFTDPMLKSRQEGLISTEEIQQQASILMLAGSETTSLGLAFTTDLLVRQRPAILAQLREELLGHVQTKSEITILSINGLTYLQAVLQESLRLFPPSINGFAKETPPRKAVIDGHFIPGGCLAKWSNQILLSWP